MTYGDLRFRCKVARQGRRNCDGKLGRLELFNYYVPRLNAVSRGPARLSIQPKTSRTIIAIRPRANVFSPMLMEASPAFILYSSVKGHGGFTVGNTVLRVVSSHQRKNESHTGPVHGIDFPNSCHSKRSSHESLFPLSFLSTYRQIYKQVS